MEGRARPVPFGAGFPANDPTTSPPGTGSQPVFGLTTRSFAIAKAPQHGDSAPATTKPWVHTGRRSEFCLRFIMLFGPEASGGCVISFSPQEDCAAGPRCYRTPEGSTPRPLGGAIRSCSFRGRLMKSSLACLGRILRPRPSCASAGPFMKSLWGGPLPSPRAATHWKPWQSRWSCSETLPRSIRSSAPECSRKRWASVSGSRLHWFG